MPIYLQTENGDSRSLFLCKMNFELLEKNVKELLIGTDNFLVHLDWKNQSEKLEIVVDADSSITSDRLAEITLEINRLLEQIEVDWKEAYTLEVSSPGLDRPLSMLRQYKKNVGRKLRATLQTGHTIEGVLEKANDTQIQLKIRNNKVRSSQTIEMSEIKTAKVLPG